MASIRKTSAILTARPGKAVELEALLRDLAAASRLEIGNLQWDLWRDQTNAEVFVIDELYVDGAAVEAHRSTPHYKAYAAKVSDLATRVAVTSVPIDIA
jgi:quinol monooxygenase YgiN